jgi:hypothetical protein|mmetsp:Transcript_58884/g.131247  ORF Transcript_58884/g.131247 Transcript_58884/m.131247 type:complete len:145 (-) Transcript_58884:230-664(-)
MHPHTPTLHSWLPGLTVSIPRPGHLISPYLLCCGQSINCRGVDQCARSRFDAEFPGRWPAELGDEWMMHPKQLSPLFNLAKLFEHTQSLQTVPCASAASTTSAGTATTSAGSTVMAAATAYDGAPTGGHDGSVPTSASTECLVL